MDHLRVPNQLERRMGRSDLGRWANLTTFGSFSNLQFWHRRACRCSRRSTRPGWDFLDFLITPDKKVAAILMSDVLRTYR